MTSMSTMIKPKIELGEGRSVDEPLKRLPVFELPTEPIETVGPTLPSTMLLGALHDPRLHLIAPLTITFERENNDIVAYCEELEEFGFGTHLTEAIEDLQAAIAEVYFTLKEEKDRLGSDLSVLLDTYYKKIKEIP